MNRAGLFQAMSINTRREKEPDTYTLRTDGKLAGRGHSYNRKATFGKVKPPPAPAMFSQVIDYSTRRGVLPCFNINRFVLRNPPQYGKTHGLIPQGGQSRSQNPSLVNPRPTNIPIHQPRSSFNAGLPSSIPLPMVARSAMA